jgi:hypothetical protein
MLARESWREKTLGEMWAAVIKTINNLLRRSVASSVGAPKWGQSRSQYMPRKGPCRTYSRGASRRPKPKYVQYSIHMHYCKEAPQPFFKHTRWKTNIQDIHCSICTCILSPAITVYFSCTSCVSIVTGVYFSQVKNKPWIPWVYTWSWHRREQFCLP